MRFRLFFFAILASLANLATGAEDSSGNLHWRCWYDQQTHITCLLDTLPQAGNPSEQAFPANLPPIVKAMRANPGSLRSKIIHIPLHTQPYDMEFTAILAKSAVCGSRRDCSVNFTDRLPPAGEIIALLNKHLPDPDPATALAMLDGNLDGIE